MKYFVAGSNGMVGKAIVKKLKEKTTNGEDIQIIQKERSQLDLIDQGSVRNFFKIEKPDVVIIAAAKVGGIRANNSFPAEFIYENLMIECNLIHESYLNNINRLLFLGSSCIYPVNSPQPMQEGTLLTGSLEPTNEPYAISKIAGISMCESYNRQYGTDYRCVMPTNLYGPNDNFNLNNSHVIPALIRKFHEATLKGDDDVVIWGTGNPLREYLHVDDMADASLYALNLSREDYLANASSHLNVGSGKECSIESLAYLIKEISGFSGNLIFDNSKPDGAPRKLLDVSALTSLGWQHTIDLKQGLKDTYLWYLENQDSYRR